MVPDWIKFKGTGPSVQLQLQQQHPRPHAFATALDTHFASTSTNKGLESRYGEI